MSTETLVIAGDDYYILNHERAIKLEKHDPSPTLKEVTILALENRGIELTKEQKERIQIYW